MPHLARYVGENAISFGLASWGTALTLRLRDSFLATHLRPLSGILSTFSATLASAFTHIVIIKGAIIWLTIRCLSPGLGWSLRIYAKRTAA